MLHRNRVGTLALAAACSLVLTAAPASADDEPYVVGLTGDLSGPASGTYKPMADGARVYFDHVNENGGINGRRVELLTRDSHSDPSQVVTDLNYFDGDGAVASIFVSPSGTLGAYQRQNATLQLPTLYINACYPPATPPNPDPNFFCPGISTLTDAFQAVELMAQLMEDEDEIRIGFITTDIPGARGAAEQIMKPHAESLGMEVVDVAVMPVGTTDLTTVARNFVDADINAVISYTISTHMLAGAEALSRRDWDGKYLMVLTLPGVYQQMTELRSENIHGWDHFSLFHEDKPIHHEIMAAAEKYGFDYPLPDIRMGYRSAMVLGAALEECGWPCSRDDLRDVMNNLTVDSQDMIDLNLDPVIFTPNNHTSPEKSYRVYRWSEEAENLEIVIDGHVAQERNWE